MQKTLGYPTTRDPILLPGPSKNRKLELRFEEVRFLFGEGRRKHFYKVYRTCGRAQKYEMAQTNWRMQNRD